MTEPAGTLVSRVCSPSTERCMTQGVVMTRQVPPGPQRTRRRWPLVVVGIGVLLVLVGLGIGAVGSALGH
jgi:hypothetical protein